MLLGDDDGTRFLETLGVFDTEPRSSTVIVNDAIREPPPRNDRRRSPRRPRHDHGVAPLAIGDPAPAEPTGFFAANAFDCVNLIALAARPRPGATRRGASPTQMPR